MFAIVSIHAPVKGATGGAEQGTFRPARFNSRSREGSDVGGACPVYHYIVSIHAPVKGATEHDATSTILIDVSIHAPVKGATPMPTAKTPRYLSFNSRSREGSDLTCHLYQLIKRIVSIHAPVKGATQLG